MRISKAKQGKVDEIIVKGCSLIDCGYVELGDYPEQENSDAELAERITRDASGEEMERADVARSFLDVGEMSEKIWERFVKGAKVYLDGRIEVGWNYGDENE